MASLNLNGKRRRVEQAASGLSKPFKSPLRRPPQIPSKETPTVKREDDDSSEKSEQMRTGQAQETLPPTPAPKPAPHPTPSVTRKRTAPTDRLTPPKKPIISDPVILDLQKQQRALQTRITAVRSDLDTAQQALRIESSNKEATLEALIAKWRRVSQDAAEEVFTGAQERVSRMGGMKGWKERMRNDTAQWEKDELEAWYGNPDAEDFSEDNDELEARKAEMLDRLDIEEPERLEKQEQHEVENEEFTMDVMLKTLNVDLKVIGYDKVEQKWVKN